MRKHIPVQGFSTGFVDDQYEDRTDIPEIANSLRECINFIPSGSGAAELRGELKRVGTWIDFDAATETAIGAPITFNNIATYPYEWDGTSLVCVIVNYTYVFQWDGTTATYAGTTGGSSTNPTRVLQIGKAMWFFQGAGSARYSLDFSGTPDTIINAQFYREISGTVEVAQRIVVKITEPLSAVSVPESIPVVGESIKGIAGTGADITGRVLRVRLNTGTGVAQTLWEYEIIIGSFDGSCSAADEVAFGTSDCIGTVITGCADTDDSYLFGTGTFFNNGLDGYIRIAGTEYTVASTTDDELILLGETATRVAGVRASKRISTSTPPFFTCAALNGGRIAYCGNKQTNAAVVSWVGSEDSVVFSDAEDPFVIAPAPQVVPNPASPILTTLVSVGSGIKWAAGGDSLIIGTGYGEYIRDPGPIGNTPELFPRFSLMGQYGSTKTTPIAVNDGRVVFSPRSGGDLIAIQYLDKNARFSGVPLNPYTSSIISDGAKAIAIRPRMDGEDSAKIFVLDSAGDDTLRVGSFQQGNVAWCRELRVDALGGNTATVKFYDLVEFGKDVYVVMQLQQTSGSLTTLESFCLCKLDMTQTDGYALDFRTDCDNVGTTWTIDGTEPALFSSDVTVIGSRNGQWVPYGTVTTSSTGTFTISADADFDDVVVGIPVYGEIVPARIVLEDETGSTLGRKVRLIAATINVKDTRQIALNSTNLLPTLMDGTVYQPFTRGAKMGFLGWAQDKRLSIQTVVPHRATIKSILYEVAA